ncbi:hypothetical protein JZ751_026784 [Albula glossodonta]|uniref:Uncharacterized protein n=1 Tax=Albula glossodonta TaxID=121402 RepID=A0A8T2PL01_9TELE|nr:hypothetical protein JZ751_026784 [Albula glossodonta]
MELRLVERAECSCTVDTGDIAYLRGLYVPCRKQESPQSHADSAGSHFTARKIQGGEHGKKLHSFCLYFARSSAEAHLCLSVSWR